jgi:alpha,alpha-trehalase
LQLYATAGRHDHLSTDDYCAVRQVVDLISKRWNDPDAGVWELNDAWWTHSRLACVAGLRSVADHVDRANSARASALALADAMLADTPSQPPAGRSVASVARPTRRRRRTAVAAGPRCAVADRPTQHRKPGGRRRETSQDGYLYRYAADDRPLGEAEGAFLMCGFAMSLALFAAGRRMEAFRRSHCQPPARQQSPPRSPC